jgi:hypothetical protein
MLRHTISVSLAMTACLTLMPTKVKAATITVTPRGEIPKNVGDLVQFTVTLDPDPSNSNSVILQSLSADYDATELSFKDFSIFDENAKVIDRTIATNIAFLIFKVLNPVQDGYRDLYNVQLRFLEGSAVGTAYGYGGDVVPIPEPLTIFGTATAALGYGAMLKRKFSKKTEF